MSDLLIRTKMNNSIFSQLLHLADRKLNIFSKDDANKNVIERDQFFFSIWHWIHSRWDQWFYLLRIAVSLRRQWEYFSAWKDDSLSNELCSPFSSEQSVKSQPWTILISFESSFVADGQVNIIRSQRLDLFKHVRFFFIPTADACAQVGWFHHSEIVASYG